MKTSAIRALFETVLPVSFIESEAARLGVQLRQRHLQLVELLVSLVLMGGSPEAGHPIPASQPPPFAICHP